VTAGPPPRLPNHRAGRPDVGQGWLPDLAARAAADESRLVGDGFRSRRRPVAPVVTIAAAVIVTLAAAVFLSQAVRRRLGIETAPTRDAATGVPARHVAAPESERGHDDSPPEKRQLAGGTANPAAAEEIPDPASIPFAEADLRGNAEPPAATSKPVRPAEQPREGPMIVVFSAPDVPRSGLGGPKRSDAAIPLPEDAEEPIEILNGPVFRLAPVPGAAPAWDVATRTGSGLGGGFALARLSRPDPRTCQFAWTEKAKTQTTQVEALKDAILALHCRDGRPIYVLLRDVKRRNPRPLLVWKDQRILYDRPEPRVRSVEWSGVPDPLEGSRWKPRIIRWRAVITRPEAAPGAGPSPRRVIEPPPDPDDKATAAEPTLERDIVPNEVKLRLAIDPARPGLIEARIDSDPDRILLGRDDRETRTDELRKATPRDKDGGDRDPIEYRKGQIAQLRQDAAKNREEIKRLEEETADLERIREIRGTEELLTREARVELSVVIGLDVEGPGILEIARIGEFGQDH
jgi:hypothetical protein